MKHYAGIDVSLEVSSVCVVDEAGAVVCEGTVASEPEALIAFVAGLGERPERIGLEAGPLSQWLHAALKAAGFATVLMETRQVADAFRSRPVKTDRGDARGLAQLVRMGWFKAVHCKSEEAQVLRALLTARGALGSKRHAIDMTIRGLLRGFGLKVGRTTARTFAMRARSLAAVRPDLAPTVEALLAARETMRVEHDRLDRRVREIARGAPAARLLMTVPGVGPIIALTFVSAIDDAERFAKSRNVGAYFGLTQRKYQSGETDRTGRISKCGDDGVRTALYEAANLILTKPLKGGALKIWAARLARRAGAKRAKVALARKLAVVMHRMLIDGTPFDAARGAIA